MTVEWVAAIVGAVLATLIGAGVRGVFSLVREVGELAVEVRMAGERNGAEHVEIRRELRTLGEQLDEHAAEELSHLRVLRGANGGGKGGTI